MGVPSFFAWLTKKYFGITNDCKRGSSIENDDLSSPNPNGVEYDNFYIDLNGLIHPCYHPTDRQTPETNVDVFVLLTQYIDYMIDIVRPRKLLYIAIDGVAPRAKMNQQRSRRFKTAYNMENQSFEEKKSIFKEKPVDSNCITPGTEFMEAVSKVIKAYIKERMNSSKYWNSIIVIFSDSSVPGEGEHKIIDFIRRQKDCKNYNPYIRHCMYGLDADLIMLALATHERYFSIIRDKPYNKGDKCYICGDYHSPDHCKNYNRIAPLDPITKPFIFVDCHVLRQYLNKTIKVEKYDFERCLDDFIFFCFLVGNDFLPRIPSLDIQEGAIDILIKIYLKFLPENGYITENGTINIKIVKKFLHLVGKEEKQLLVNRRLRKEKEDQIYFDKRMRELDYQIQSAFENRTEALPQRKTEIKVKSIKEVQLAKEESQLIKESLEKKKQELFHQIEELKNDEIQLGEPGYEERYYQQKFHVEYKKEKSLVIEIIESYVEGLNWVFSYYYEGCQSWDWYYPYYYAPFAKDIGKLLDPEFEVQYTQGKPFRPFEQLLSVLPPQSKHCLPKEFRQLMNSTSSPLSNFYPEEFKIDMNGERSFYKAIALIGFINQKKLLSVVEPIEKDLGKKDQQRNSRYGNAFIFIGKSNWYYRKDIHQFKKTGKEAWKQIKKEIKTYISNDQIVPIKTYKPLHIESNYTKHQFGGLIIPVRGMDLGKDKSKCYMLGYIPPQYKNGHIFKTRYIGEPLESPQSLDSIKVKSQPQRKSIKRQRDIREYRLIPLTPDNSEKKK
ncbi:5'-3' exoribonuclease, putative [Entamoeba dispar SAW760]|uniref:5'-3' exoribonuclease n=1 Tax=Entamoeba dispar (strain ATCC PRA-260 / SAW760) TaxID=370354 RepID=B0ETH4_ENTDS|nr:5'-3' exoribonuclease, putative [Entamoeba dispar SAW760]EDR22159.1 5'-3' exoribonuclease, putative [Entamoeba dispar SAW760]|eukprot:EDR22159.1 5'-3' exoribonuclease, putative [Entamoeba dispar SAW760]